MTKLSFGDGDVFVDLSLLNILVATIISIYNNVQDNNKKKPAKFP